MLLNLFEFMLDLDKEKISSKEFDKRLYKYFCRISRGKALKLYKELRLFKDGKSVVPEGVYDIEKAKIDKAEEYLWLKLLFLRGLGPTQFKGK